MRTISIVLKEGRINFRDAQGNVQSVNVLSDAKTSEMLQAITEAGEAAVETIERITPDIPTIKADITQLGKDVAAETAARTAAVSTLNGNITRIEQQHGTDVTRLEGEIAKATPKDYESVKETVNANATAITTLENDKADKIQLRELNEDIATLDRTVGADPADEEHGEMLAKLLEEEAKLWAEISPMLINLPSEEYGALIATRLKEGNMWLEKILLNMG